MTTPAGGSRDGETISALLVRLRGEIELTLATFRLEPGEAEAVLQEVLFMLIYRWDRIGDRELWLLSALRRGCLRCLEARGALEEAPP